MRHNGIKNMVHKQVMFMKEDLQPSSDRSSEIKKRGPDVIVINFLAQITRVTLQIF